MVVSKPYTPTNLHRSIRSHSVFIFRVGTSEHGSGVLITISNRVFVLSAAHVIEGDIDINLGIIPHESRFTILNKWYNDESDVGFVELDPIEVKFRLSEISSPFPVGKKGSAAIPSKKTTLALCGFPGDEATITSRGREIPVSYITVSLLAHEQWHEDIKSRFDPSKHFVLPYGPKWGSFVDGNKNPRDPISPFGISGSGLWLYDQETEDSDKPLYSLVGIQHRFNKEHQLVIGTLIDELIDQLAAHYLIQLPTIKGGAA